MLYTCVSQKIITNSTLPDKIIELIYVSINIEFDADH